MSAVLRFKSLRDIVCEQYQRKFLDLFEDEVTVTPAICAAVADIFPWNGVACRLLTEKLSRRFERKRTLWMDQYYAWRTSAVRIEACIQLESTRVNQLQARFFAELFNDKDNAPMRAKLRRLARKK